MAPVYKQPAKTYQRKLIVGQRLKAIASCKKVE
jgi:hypothetical protein